MDRVEPDPTEFDRRMLMVFLKALSGVFEGFILGALQFLALRRLHPGLSASKWIGWTTVLAVVGWATGSAIPIFGQFAEPGAVSPEPPLTLVMAFAALFGAIVGTLFGAVQSLALREVAHGSRYWTLANAVGWGAALPVIYLIAGSIEPGLALLQLAVAGLAAGLCAGLILGAVTGLAFHKLVSVQEHDLR